MPQSKKPPAEPEAPEINGILVNVAENGELTVQVLGTIKPTEAPTVLRIAAQDVERQFGIKS